MIKDIKDKVAFERKKARVQKVFESGVTYNPLKKHRNIKCPCGSDLKAKRCCGRFNVLPVDVAKAIKKVLPK